MKYRKSSKSSIRPHYYTITELPEHLREEFITVGLIWADEVKPKMNLFLEPIYRKLKEAFEEGITWPCPETGEERLTRVNAPSMIADKPARAEVGNFMHLGCRYGCETCDLRTIKCSAKPGRKRKKIFPYPEEEPVPRTKKRMLAQARKADELNIRPDRQVVAKSSRINVKEITGNQNYIKKPSINLTTEWL
ncbi:hypothetical protein QAD02_000423 [Eretmocerus hayati]|uniref:Uncharacterized protein n=1 Tax=Eretmocerus hayati TaxID=131215 RepID=A0ACC2NDM0_9HYME|nr:hypothetical protein QAD02_000423 [Eretmocerus hayati]